MEDHWDVLDKHLESPTYTTDVETAFTSVVPESTSHLQGSSGVCISTGQGSKRGATQNMQAITMLPLIGVSPLIS